MTLPPPSENIEEWSQRLLEQHQTHTKDMSLTPTVPAVDPHLDHLWATRRGLLNRWHRQKHNRALKCHIAQITQQDLKYAQQLHVENWRTFCDQLGGTLTIKRTWCILRRLMGAALPKTATSENVTWLLHNHQCSPADILTQICTNFWNKHYRRTPPWLYWRT